MTEFTARLVALVFVVLGCIVLLPIIIIHCHPDYKPGVFEDPVVDVWREVYFYWKGML